MVNTRAVLFTGTVTVPTPGDRRADPGIGEHHLSRLRPVGLAQAAIELQDVGDVLRDLVAGAVKADDEFFGSGLGECSPVGPSGLSAQSGHKSPPLSWRKPGPIATEISCCRYACYSALRQRPGSPCAIAHAAGRRSVKGVPHDLTSGRFIGHEQDRGIVQFSMQDGAKEIPCAISTTAMDDLERGPQTRSHEREAQFTRLRDRIEARAASKYRATEFEGTPPGIVLRSIDFRG